MRWIMLAFSTLSFSFAPSSPKPDRINWESFLPVIAQVESWGNGIATSFWDEEKKIICARGKYQITRSCYEDFKIRHPQWEFLKIEMLYNEKINEMISLDTLSNLENQMGYGNLWIILSCYHTGPSNYFKYGLNWDYVNKIITNKLCPSNYRVSVGDDRAAF